jgi:hypothetical protein|uniref:Uncharacterized protein n=1 Tax=Siphoviridae sp. ctgEf12 TaxID=2825605 RepID=A0A8S5NU87_9CAUD|nr:MAG TPA: hypothetical protein [Siphoviridae sp. ctgEf12]DAS12296.1 MAG TPA: hypothetical protein [Caudoviricetes sp.]DAX24846.1 MAG TPA: hypothetical protein [Caudoviricetes sp.]
MFLIFWVACIYFYVRVIRFGLKEISKIKEYRKTMSKKEAKKKIKSERTKRDKLDSILAVVFLFLAVVSSPNSGNKTETAEKKEVKKVEAKKEEVKKEEPKGEAKTTEVDKSIATKEQKRLVTFLENADNQYFDDFKEILGAFDKQDSEKAKRLLSKYKTKLKDVYNNVLDYECKPTENRIFDKECGEITQLASEEYTLKNNIINEIENFFNDPNQTTLDNVRNQFLAMIEKKEELKDRYIIFKNKNF